MVTDVLYIDGDTIEYNPLLMATWIDLVGSYNITKNQNNQIEYNSKVIYYQGVAVLDTDLLHSGTQYVTITITGGTDATNATLIAWLETNATQQVSGGSLFLGSLPIDKMFVGSSEVQSVWYGTEKVWEKQASGYTVHIKITYNNSATGWGKYSLDEGVNYTSLSYNTEVVLSNVTSLYVKGRADDGPRVAIDTSSYKNYSNYTTANIDVLDAFSGDMEYDESDYSSYADITQYLQNDCYVSLILRG